MSNISTILGDLGFASGDDVIDSDLIGEVESVIGAKATTVKTNLLAKPPGGVALPKGARVPTQTPVVTTAPSKTTSNVALPKLTKPSTSTAAPALSKTTSNVALPKLTKTTASLNTPVQTTDPSKTTSNVALPKTPATADKIAASNKRIAAAQSNLKTAVRSTLDKANKLKTKAKNLASKPASARAAQRFSRLADHLTRSGTQLKNLADKKQLTKTVKVPKKAASSIKSTNKLVDRKKPVFSIKNKNILGALLEELLGEEAYDPYTSERDPQTVAEAEVYVQAAQESYDSAKAEEVAAADEVKRIINASEGTGDNSAYDDAIATGMEAALARGDAGVALSYGQELLAALKDQPTPPPEPPPPSGDTSTPAPPPSGDTSTPAPPPSGDTSTPAPPPDDGAMPPPTDGLPPPDASEAFPPGPDQAIPPDMSEGVPTGYGYPPGYGYPTDPYGNPIDPYGQPELMDPYGGFVDPFSGVPSNAERASRGHGASGLEDFFKGDSDADFAVEAIENAQDATYASAMRSVNTPKTTSPDSVLEFDGVIEPSGVEEGAFDEEVLEPSGVQEDASQEPAVQAESAQEVSVVGNYLLGTTILIGCVFGD